jgi:hypothetical protein
VELGKVHGDIIGLVGLIVVDNTVTPEDTIVIDSIILVVMGL